MEIATSVRRGDVGVGRESRIPATDQAHGAEGGIRTHTPLRAADFESAASTIPPLRRCVPCEKKEWSGRGDSNPRPSPWQGDALPLSHFRSDRGMSLHPYSTKNQAAVNPSRSLAPHRTQPRHPHTTPAVIPAPPTPSFPRKRESRVGLPGRAPPLYHPPSRPCAPRHPSTLPPHGRRASDRRRPCHPPLALAPRRLYTFPMRNPTSAYPGLPDAARGTSQRSRNCPESGPPYPRNGSCWTRRIVSAVDRFEADSFPEKENLGGGTNRRSSARPQGPSPRRACLGGPTLPRWPAARTRAAPIRRATPQPSPHVAVAPATHPPQSRRAATRVKPRRRCRGVSRQRIINAQSHAEATGSLHQANNQPFVYLPGSEGAKKRQTIHRTITIKQPAAGGHPLRRRRTGATPLLCSALQCFRARSRDMGHTQALERYGDLSTTVTPAPTHPRHSRESGNPGWGWGAWGSLPYTPPPSSPRHQPSRPTNPPPTKPSHSDRHAAV